MTVRCKDCAFAFDAGGHGKGLSFNCRRFPPQLNRIDGPNGPYWENVSPLVSADDWCGEFRRPDAGPAMGGLFAVMGREKPPF